MRNGLAVLAAGVLIAAAGPPADPLRLDLEQVDAPAALAQVRDWNARTLGALEKQPGFAERRARALRILADPARLAEPEQVLGDTVTNLWQDADHPRGLWRASPLADFAAGRPRWRTLIDVDALGRAEGHRWVFKGATCLKPQGLRCLVRLSDGGGDAVVVREFDVSRGAFVDDGFTLPAAKSQVAWAGPDTLYVATDFGPDSLTRSGYPRIVKRWQRGTPLAAATIVAEGQPSDVSVAATVWTDGAAHWTTVSRAVDFYHHQVSHVASDGRLVPSPLPADADVEDVLDGRVIALVKSPWRSFAPGTLVAYSIPDLLAGRAPAFETVFRPTPTQAVEHAAAGRTALWIEYLDTVSGRLAAVQRGADGRWTAHPLPLPDKLTVHLDAAAPRADLAFVRVEGMLTPPALVRAEVQSTGILTRARQAPRVAPVQVLPARFDASGMVVEQRFAKSKDGTRVPYFFVHRRDLTGPVPALIHAYGGFELAQTPSYLTAEPYRSGPAALFWVEEGNAYVLANIRGGGEFGPAWHAAALRDKRQNAYDDLYAVAEDLVRAGVTAKGRIAVSGRSNGGLMAGVAMTERPDLFGAAVIGSPLLDMRRFSHLSAGASWMGEYGDPDKPADWAFISRYSPYQALRVGVRYPVPFLYTSTRDDRVHPGHARRFAAKLEAMGDPFFYDEAIEGGHAAGVEPAEDAERAALVASYLDLELPHDAPPRHVGP